MKKYILDTAPLTALLLGRPRAISLVAFWLIDQEVATSILVYGEVSEYIKGFPNYQSHRNQLQVLLLDVTPLHLSYAILERYADIRRQSRPPHGSGLIGDVDTLIAATALEHDLTLVTTDSDFQRVPGLKLMRVASLR